MTSFLDLFEVFLGLIIPEHPAAIVHLDYMSIPAVDLTRFWPLRSWLNYLDFVTRLSRTVSGMHTD